MNTKEWLLEWFAEKTGMTQDVLILKKDDNYFDNGLIDSFSFISLISEIENTFQINFSNDEFLNRKFGTISGLSQIIDTKIQNDRE